MLTPYTRPCLQVVDALDELRHAVRWAEQSLDLDVDVRAHVFELTIRSLGGLLSAHSLLIRDPALVPGLRQALVAVTISVLKPITVGAPSAELWKSSACRLSGPPAGGCSRRAAAEEPVCKRPRHLQR